MEEKKGIIFSADSIGENDVKGILKMNQPMALVHLVINKWFCVYPYVRTDFTLSLFVSLVSVSLSHWM